MIDIDKAHLDIHDLIKEQEASEAGWDEEDEETVECRNCNGEGHFYHEDEDWQEMCTVCEGNGYIYKSDESLLDKILPTPEQLLARGDLSDPDRKMWEDFLRQEEFDKNNPDPIEDALIG